MRPTLSARLVDLLLRRRAALLILLAVATVALGLAATRLEFVTSPESLLDTDDPSLVELRRHEGILGGFEHTAIVVLPVPDAFAARTLSRLDSACEGISEVEGVEEVRSLTRSGFPLPDRTADPAAFRRAALRNPVVSPLLVSADGRTTAIHARLAEEVDTGFARDAVLDGIAEAARAEGFEPALAGVPAVRRAYADSIRTDLFVLPPAVGILLAVLLFAAFRRLLPVLALLGTVFVVAVLTVGTLSLTGGRVSALTSILPALLVVLGIATGVHVVAAYREEKERGADSREAARRAMSRMALPSALTSLTTAVGFLSLALAGMRDVREFGIYSAVGALLSFLVGTPLTGICLSFLPDRGRSVPLAHPPVDPVLRRLARLLLRRPARGILAGGLLAAVAVTGLPLLESDTRMLEDIRPGAPIRVATETVDRKLGGVIGFDLVLDADGDLAAAGAIRWAADLEDRLRALPDVRAVLGPGTLVRAAAESAGLEPGAAAPLVLAALRARGGGEALRSVLAPDHRLARIAIRTGDVGSVRTGEIERTALALARASAPEDVRVEIGGLAVLAEIVLDRLVREMGRSTLVAFVSIFLLLTVIFRSLLFGALSMIPNLLPLVVAAGYMGFAGITVRSSIALIFAVALGIAVDDTIHLLVRYRRERRRGRSGRAATVVAIRCTGRPVVLTSVVLLAGFLTFLVSDFQATEDFGMVASVTIASALVGDLLLLPGLLLAGAGRNRQRGRR